MLQAYINAIVPLIPKIWNKQLLPFSLGHSYILTMLHSPFLYGGDVKISDIATAIWVCSQPFITISTSFSNMEKVKKDISKWSDKLKIDMTQLKQARELIEVYLDYYNTLPEKWNNPNNKGRALKVPWQLFYIYALSDRFKISELWDMPLSMIFALNACALEFNSQDNDLMSEDDIETRDYINNVEDIKDN